MPKVIKKRPAKKKAAQENEVKSAALKALDKMKERQKHLIIALSAVAAIVILFVVFSLYSSSAGKKAYSLEMEAYKYYYGENIDDTMTDEDRWKKALELYNESVEAKETPSALFYVANCYYNLKDYDNAIKEYVRFTDTFSGNKGLLPLVYQKLASVYFKTNQNDKALDALAGLAKVDHGIFKDTALILEARYYDAAGEKEKALEKYKEVIADFPQSAWGSEANAKVSAEEAQKAEALAEKKPDEKGETSEEPAPAPEKEAVAPEQPEKGQTE